MRPRMLFVPATRRPRLAAILLLALLPLYSGLAAAAPQNVSGGVRFTYLDPAAGSVNWAGAFNNWSTSATPLAKGSDGIWSVDVALPAGSHEYKLVINGSQWIGDPENPMTSGPASYPAPASYPGPSSYSGAGAGLSPRMTRPSS